MNFRKKVNKTETVYIFIIIAYFFIMLYLTWNKWGNLLVDSFRDLWVASQICQGKVLYKDVYYLMGIFPPYLLAFLMKHFGIHIQWIIYIGMSSSLLATALIYKTARFFLPALFSSFVSLFFISVCVFGNYCTSSIFNWIFPYSIASTLFSLCTIGSLYFHICYIKKENIFNMQMFIFSIMMSFLCRPVMAILPWIGFVLSGLFLKLLFKKQVNMFYLFLPFIISVLIYGVFVVNTDSWLGFKESILDMFWFTLTGKYSLNQYSSGFNNPISNILIMSKLFALQFIVFAFLCLLSNYLSKFINRSSFLKFCINYFWLSLLSYFSCRLLFAQIIPPDFFRSLPVVLLISFIYLVIFYYKKNRYFSHNYALLTLFVISIIMLHRVILNVTLIGYSFFLVPLGIIGFYYFLVKIIPRIFKYFLKINRSFFKYYYFAISIFSIVTIYYMTNDYWWFYKEKSFSYKSRLGNIVCLPDIQSIRMIETIQYIIKNTALISSVAVLPEGIGINFLTGRPTPLRYEAFLPYQLNLFGEEKVLAQFEKSPPNYIVIVGRTTDLYGAQSFGKDYGVRIFNWIKHQYLLIHIIGCMPFVSDEFGVAIYKYKY